jgi:hypothetical protein
MGAVNSGLKGNQAVTLPAAMLQLQIAENYWFLKTHLHPYESRGQGHTVELKCFDSVGCLLVLSPCRNGKIEGARPAGILGFAFS